MLIGLLAAIQGSVALGAIAAGGMMRWRFSPKDAKIYRYVIRSNVPGLEGKCGELTSLRPPPDAAGTLRRDYPSGGRTIPHRKPPRARTSAPEQ